MVGGGSRDLQRTTGHFFILVAFFVRNFIVGDGGGRRGGGKILKIEMSNGVASARAAVIAVISAAGGVDIILYSVP